MSYHLDGRHDFDENHSRRPSVFVEINMIPFIDVCLVLLIIFMVTAPFSISGVNVKLPETSAKNLESKSQILTLTISKNGNFFLGNEQVKENKLVSKLKELSAKDQKNYSVFIRADKDVSYGKVMSAMSSAQTAGIQKIGMIGEDKSANK